MIMGDNGIIRKAQLAKEKTEEVQRKEDSALADYENQIGQYVNGTRNENENKYSTKEQVIGTWVDGKPLYRKVYEVNSPKAKDSSEVVLDTTDLNVDIPVNVYGVIFISNDGTCTPLNIAFNSGDVFATWFNRDNVYMRCTGNRTNLPCKVILEYTKTTD